MINCYNAFLICYAKVLLRGQSFNFYENNLIELYNTNHKMYPF